MKTLTLEINIPNSTFPSAHSFLSAATDGFIEGLNSIFVGAALNYYSVQNAFDEEDEVGDPFSVFRALDAIDPAVEEAVTAAEPVEEPVEEQHDFLLESSAGGNEVTFAIQRWLIQNGYDVNANFHLHVDATRRES